MKMSPLCHFHLWVAGLWVFVRDMHESQKKYSKDFSLCHHHERGNREHLVWLPERKAKAMLERVRLLGRFTFTSGLRCTPLTLRLALGQQYLIAAISSLIFAGTAGLFRFFLAESGALSSPYN